MSELKELSTNKAFNMLFERGWQIWNCSCVCGGRYAWMKPRSSGAFETFGCICHTSAIAMIKDLIIKDTVRSIAKEKLDEELFEI